MLHDWIVVQLGLHDCPVVELVLLHDRPSVSNANSIHKLIEAIAHSGQTFAC